jgi:NAD-dependent dihydropyrimidine dehydrogenase PreA subunit
MPRRRARHEPLVLNQTVLVPLSRPFLPVDHPTTAARRCAGNRLLIESLAMVMKVPLVLHEMGLVLQPPACRRSYASTVTYVIGRACVDVMDKSCMQECPVDCIYEGVRSLYINPDECLDCGACKLICRMDAPYVSALRSPGVTL